jgi:endoglucanase
MIALWHRIADHYSTYSTGTMVYELLDSPRYNSATAYHNLVSDIVSALHDVAAKNTIIVDVPKQASVDGFAGFTPLTTGTVWYAFHFYEPYLFTHQGLKMASSFGRSLRRRPRPIRSRPRPRSPIT